jgi:hypothetical protein
MYSLTFEFYSILKNFFKFSLVFTSLKWFSHLTCLWTLHPDTPELLMESTPRFPFYVFNCLLTHLLAPSLQEFIFISSITSVSFPGFLSPLQSSKLFIVIDLVIFSQLSGLYYHNYFFSCSLYCQLDLLHSLLFLVTLPFTYHLYFHLVHMLFSLMLFHPFPFCLYTY